MLFRKFCFGFLPTIFPACIPAWRWKGFKLEERILRSSNRKNQLRSSSVAVDYATLVGIPAYYDAGIVDTTSPGLE